MIIGITVLVAFGGIAVIVWRSGRKSHLYEFPTKASIDRCMRIKQSSHVSEWRRNGK